MRGRRRRGRTYAALLVVAVAAVSGCGASSGSGAAAPASASAADSSTAVTGQVTVLAAASLTESFDALIAALQKQHPGLTINVSYGSSATLAQQIVSGAPVDVFAAASDATMKTVTDAGDGAAAPVIFARNQLEIAVPKGNPGKVAGLADLGRDELRVVVCDPSVPCGATAQKLAAATGVTLKPDSLGTDVKETLNQVDLGEADAALVYRTDIATAGDKVQGIEIPEAAKAITNYPIVVVKGAGNAAGARLFVDAVTGAQGQQQLAAVGFIKP